MKVLAKLFFTTLFLGGLSYGKNIVPPTQFPNSRPVAFSHIGITVPDLEKAVEFYTKVLGLYMIMPPTTIHEDNSAIGRMCVDVFGKGFGSFRIAHLSTADRVGIELFEFQETSRDPKAIFKPKVTGIFHFSIQDPDVEGLVKKIVAAGGKQRMPVRAYYPGDKPYRMVYCEDPFGNIIEIYSHSYELTYSMGAYQGINATLNGENPQM